MTKAEKQRWRDAETLATYYMGLVGLEIKMIIRGIEDYAVYIYTGDNSVHKSKIYYEAEASYFMFAGHRVRLDECVSIF